MAQTCLICNQSALGTNYIENVFDGDGDSESHILPSGHKLQDILCEIIDKPLSEDSSYSKILCTECNKTISNYDMYKSNVSILKAKLSNQYKSTQQSFIDSEVLAQKVEEISPTNSKYKGKLIVPASKLHPVPADFQLNLGKIAALANSVQSQKPLLNLKVTIGNSVLTQSLTTSTVKMVKPADLSADTNTINFSEWSVNTLPSEIFSNNEDRHMEIVAEQKIQEQPIYVDASTIKDENAEEPRFIHSENYELILEGQEGDDQSHTIVLDSDNSILQMMMGQKLVYDNEEFSLVVDDNDDDDDPDAGAQDSNDEESQIELQVSGDEETANAIIAAAKEQGGAFIKVESGEMYRVKSVQSTPRDTAGDTRDTGVSHATLVSRDGDKYTCLVCDNTRGPIKRKYRGDAEEMVRHMKEEHSAKVYICALCDTVIRNRALYTAHMTEHIHKTPRVRSYDCDLCKKSYNSRTLLQEHMNVHTGDRPYSCHVCDKTFASKYTRQAHLKTHQVRPRNFKCDTCPKSFLTQQNLLQHQKTHLGIKSFVCSVCEKAFSTQHSLEVHGIVHSGEKSHVCPVCSKAFARRAELADHLRIHTGERPFECDVCGAKFSQRSNLHSHKRATHFGVKRHECPDCPKRFKRRRLLQYHIKAAHTGERPLRCDICQNTFVYPEHYKKHMMIHKGDRPFVCEICGKSFTSRDNRNIHRFVHSDKKPYECLACGVSYMRKRMLVAHMNANGHLAESIVVNQPRVTKVEESLFSNADVKFIEDINGEGKLVNMETEDQENGNLYTISEENSENSIIAAANGENSDVELPEISNAKSELLRFIQVKMADGKDGWVALSD